MSLGKVLICGAGGQLGAALHERLEKRWRVDAAARGDLDVTDARSVRERVRSCAPDWIVNCSAWTQVDAAEIERDAAFLVNDAAPGFLADAALEVGARVLHFSTDYVFDGVWTTEPPRPYTEEDEPNPLSVYGASKLAGERRLLEHEARGAVLRSSWLYGELGQNFFLTMLRLGRERKTDAGPLRVVDDQVGTPTDVRSLAAQSELVMIERLEGLFHASCSGQASWFDFACAIFELAGLAVDVDPCDTSEFPRPAPRPANAVLENARLAKLRLDCMPPWRESLSEIVERHRALSRPS